jgi:hypothetical protein
MTSRSRGRACEPCCPIAFRRRPWWPAEAANAIEAMEALRRGPSTRCCSTCTCRAPMDWPWRRRCAAWPTSPPWCSSPPTPNMPWPPSTWKRSTTSPSRCGSNACRSPCRRSTSWCRRAGAGDGPETLVIQDRGRTERVPLSEVLYFKAELKYITVRTSARSYILDGIAQRTRGAPRGAVPARPPQRAGCPARGARAREARRPRRGTPRARAGRCGSTASMSCWRCRGDNSARSGRR